MRSKLLLLTVGTAALAACNTTGQDMPDRGMASVNVPVVTSADYVFDAAAPGGSLAPGEGERLNAWFAGLGLGYGDAVYVDGAYSGGATAQVAQIAGRYGLLVQPSAPVTAGLVAPGSVRVVVSRRRAQVPGCPNWDRPSEPDFNNRSMSNYGCAVNVNFAAQVANPEDLIHGRDGLGVSDAATAAKALQLYRTAPPTGARGLQDINTKGTK
jgi:pilus assembly protein CpaD